MEKRNVGRPSNRTPETLAAICKLVELGDRPEDAAAIEHVSRSTFYEWKAECEEFRTAIARAEALYKSRARGRIQKGDSKGVSFGPAKAELELISRRFPKEWAAHVKVEVAEVERHCFEALSNVCGNAEIIERVSETKDLSVVFEKFCEELARLDGEGAAGSAPSTEERGGAEAPIH